MKVAFTKELLVNIRGGQLLLVDFVLMLAGFTCLGAGVYYVFLADLSLAVTALTAGLIVLFASTIDRFESLKGWGIEAKTKKLDATIDKAELAMKELKALAELTGGTLISLTSSVGRWGSAPGIFEAYAFSRKVAGVLRRLDSSEADIRAALVPWARSAAMDLFKYLVQRAHEVISERVNELDATKIQLSTDDQLKLFAKARVALEHPGRLVAEMSTWALPEFEHKALQLIEGAPLLEEATRSRHRAEFARAAAELKFLAADLDFQDTELWHQVRRKE